MYFDIANIHVKTLKYKRLNPEGPNSESPTLKAREERESKYQ